MERFGANAPVRYVNNALHFALLGVLQKHSRFARCFCGGEGNRTPVWTGLPRNVYNRGFLCVAGAVKRKQNLRAVRS